MSYLYERFLLWKIRLDVRVATWLVRRANAHNEKLLARVYAPSKGGKVTYAVGISLPVILLLGGLIAV